MNTSKQVNVMIGILFLSFLLFGGYILYEPTRAADAEEHITERNAARGARTFVNNCRNCHGLEGKGPEEGGIAPALNTPAFRIIDEHEAEELGIEPTGQGEADAIRSFLFNTISCGRTGTFMPLWAQRFGGSLSDTQINQLVTLITEGRWDLVAEIGAEADAETGSTAEDILVQDPSTLSVTERNCGQFNSENAAEIRARDPFSPATPTPAGAATPADSGQTATPAPGGADGGGAAVPVVLTEFAVQAPSSRPSGDIAFRAENAGAIVHELTVIRTDLAADALPTAGGRADESRLEVVATSPDIQARRSVELRTDLTDGRYVLICNVPGHYQAGMRTAFTAQ